METLAKLNPTTYTKQIPDELLPTGIDWKDEAKTESGLIAQDILIIDELKHLVSVPDDEDNHIFGLDYKQLIPFLVASIKELQSRIDVLENMSF